MLLYAEVLVQTYKKESVWGGGGSVWCGSVERLDKKIYQTVFIRVSKCVKKSSATGVTKRPPLQLLYGKCQCISSA
jgi:hypothetical protein